MSPIEYAFVFLVMLTTVSALCVALVLEIIAYFLSRYFKRNDIADVFWGLGFVTLALLFFFNLSALTTEFRIMFVLVLVWGIRLVLHIGSRFFSTDTEDTRYLKWRTTWKWFKTRSFFQIFLLQGFIMTLVMMPLIAYVSAPGNTPQWQILCGLALWSLGFFFEVVGDWQLRQFIKDPRRYGLTKGDLMTRGLWSLTRHPNYFGEICMWWGIWIICLYNFNPVYIAASIIGPIVITVLLCFVSGVRLTERSWAQHYGKKYEQYKKTVPVLIPWGRWTN